MCSKKNIFRLKSGKCKVFFRTYLFKFATKKPAETRMGKGKGSFSKWFCPLRRGQIFVEFKFSRAIKRFSYLDIFMFLRQCQRRLPVKTKIIIRKGENISSLRNGMWSLVFKKN